MKLRSVFFWDLCSFGMWLCISGRLVPSVLRHLVGLVFKGQTFPPWLLNTSGARHPVMWYHIPEKWRPWNYALMQVMTETMVFFPVLHI